MSGLTDRLESNPMVPWVVNVDDNWKSILPPTGRLGSVCVIGKLVTPGKSDVGYALLTEIVGSVIACGLCALRMLKSQPSPSVTGCDPETESVSVLKS
jgi:hypothetical protein